MNAQKNTLPEVWRLKKTGKNENTQETMVNRKSEHPQNGQ